MINVGVKSNQLMFHGNICLNLNVYQDRFIYMVVWGIHKVYWLINICLLDDTSQCPIFQKASSISVHVLEWSPQLQVPILLTLWLFTLTMVAIMLHKGL